MSKIGYPDKVAGADFTAAEATEIKNVVNTNDDAANAKNITFGTAIPFSSMYGIMAAKTIDQAYVFTKNVTDQITFGACQIPLTANGNAAHVPDFSAFKKTDNGIDWDNTLDVLNLIYIWYDGVTHRYLISRAEVGTKFISAVMAADNSKITLTLDKASYTSGNGTGALVLADYGFAFAANGGTATGWNRTSITKVGGTALVGGETVLEIHGTVVGTPNGSETVTVTPVASAIFDGNGNAMDVGESVASSMSVAPLLQDSFTDTNGVTLAAHTPEIGSSGASQGGSHEIQSNKLTAITNGTALWDVGVADIDISAIINVGNVVDPSIIYGRWGDIANGDNRIIAEFTNANTLKLSEVVAGVLVEIGTAPALTYTTGDHTMRMICKGSNVKVLIDDVEIRNETTNLLVGNLCGYFIRVANSCDNLLVSPS